MGLISLASNCFASSLLIGIFLSCFYVAKNKKLFQDYRKSLNVEQRKVYFTIVKERSNIFYIAVVASIILSGILSHFLIKYKKDGTDNLSCFFITSTLSLTCLIYLIYPKSDRMYYHLTSDLQRDQWRKINNQFSNAKMSGLLFGGIGYFVAAATLV